MAALRKIKVNGNRKVSVFRSLQNQILQKDITTIPSIKTVLNVGSRQDESDKEGKLYRDYFEQVKYFTLDKNHEVDHPQHLKCDLHDLSAVNKKFDLILLMSVLEHVEMPWQVFDQLGRLMHEDSYIFVTVPFFYPLHKDPGSKYSDYWRFTADALPVLAPDLEIVWFKPIDSVILAVEDRDAYWDIDNTLSGYAILLKKKKVSSTNFETELDAKTGLIKRKYPSYQEYLKHQGEKLDKTYEKILQSDQEYEKVLEKRIADLHLSLSGKTVLCLGARLGGEVRAFKSLGSLAIGTDINPGKENTDVIYGDVHDIKFPDQVFDCVYTNIIDHVLDIPRFVEEVARVLKPDGVFLVEWAQVGLNPNKYEVTDVSNFDQLLKIFSANFAVNSVIDIENKTQFINWSGKLVLFRKVTS